MHEHFVLDVLYIFLTGFGLFLKNKLYGVTTMRHLTLQSREDEGSTVVAAGSWRTEEAERGAGVRTRDDG